MTKPKIAVCTTFPKEHFEICAAEMIASFHAHWPEDIKMYVQLDPAPDEESKALWNACIDAASEERLFPSHDLVSRINIKSLRLGESYD